MSPRLLSSLQVTLASLLLFTFGACRQLPEASPPPLGYKLQQLLDEPTTDRWLEVELEVARVPTEERLRIADHIWAVNLTSDHWTIDWPAAVMVRNDTPDVLLPQLPLITYAPPEVRPKVILHDGDERRVLEHEPSKQLVELAPVLPGSSRMYVIGTDATWKPGTQDQRDLGVQVVSLDRIPELF